MKTVALDISSLSSGHRLRGVGFYTKKLHKGFKENGGLVKNHNLKIVFFEGKSIPDGVDLVHYPYFDPFFLTLPLFKKTKTVVTVHDLIPLVLKNYYPRGVRGEIKWQMQKLALKGTVGVIADSDCSKKDIKRIIGFDENRIFRVYLAADEKFRKLKSGGWEDEIRKKYGLAKDFILYVGDVNYNKNVEGLIRAFGKLKAQKLNLVLVGGAFLEKGLMEAERVQKLVGDLDLGKDVVLPGQVEDSDLVKIYNLASLYVQPSFYEGFGLPVLEAMKCGCPVVCSDKGSLAEIGGKAVLYFDPYSVENMAVMIKKILADSYLKKDLVAKGEIQAKMFSWKKTINETVKAYNKILA